LAWLKEDFGKRSVKREKGKEGEEGKVNKLDELFNIISHLILIYCSKLFILNVQLKIIH
jgi:hypothetical protein